VELRGAGVTTQRELVSQMERQTGKKLKLRIAGKTMLRLIGPIRKTPYTEGIRQTLAAMADSRGLAARTAWKTELASEWRSVRYGSWS
jgi:hypothetical protein